MKTILVPKNSRVFPTKKIRHDALIRNEKYTKDLFEKYNDWFYFVHIDPIQRFIHAFGMVVGLFFFIMIFLEWSAFSILYYFLGVFFFYVLGIISHKIFDHGTGESERKYLLHTTYIVISINLQTLFFQYNKSLKKFVKKYPFVIEAYDLIEIPSQQLTSYLIGGAKRQKKLRVKE